METKPTPALRSVHHAGFVLALSLLAFAGSLTARAQSPPATFDHTISNGVSSVLVHFTTNSVRGPNFNVLVHDAAGAFNPFSPGPVRTYLGTVEGFPGAMACAVRRANGAILSRVAFEDGTEWVSTGGQAYVLTGSWTPNWPGSVPGAGGAGSTIYAAEVGVDVKSLYYDATGGSAGALEMIEYSILSANIVYLRDAGLVHRLGRVILRSSLATDPYAGQSDFTVLQNMVQTQWTSVLPPNTHDLVALATPEGTGAGYACVGCIGTGAFSSNGSEVNGDFSRVWRHEGGHNWSLGHYNGGTPEGATINSGNSLARMSCSEEFLVLNQRTAKLGYLDNLGAYAWAIPPRAAMDRFEFEPDAGSGLLLDVLGNDHDANGQTLSLLNPSPNTDAGGTISPSAGTGPGGRDQISYAQPALGLIGTDHFTYRIQDSSGQQALGHAMVRTAIPGELAGHWTFDDAAGATARDSSSYRRHGTLNNNPAWTNGVHGGALAFDGANDRVLAVPLNLNTNQVTLSMWIRRAGAQEQFAELIFFSSDFTGPGFNFGIAGELGYHWEQNDWTWDSGLIPPNNVWTFVALVVEPTKATVYMQPTGGALQTAVHNSAHAVKAFAQLTEIGGKGYTRTFKGLIDDVRVYRRAFSSNEIVAAIAGMGTAANPIPASGATVGGASVRLNWTAPPSAVSRQVYFSANYAAVRDGTPGSAADQGATNSTAWPLAPLSAGVYFWRVDESNGSLVAKGPVWTFSVTNPVLVATFTGGDVGEGLDFQGVFPYAVNIGGNGAPGLVGDANFTADNAPGVSVTAPGGTIQTLDTWANPTFGATTNDDRLEQALRSIRYTIAPATLTVTLANLQAGRSYKLQMLFVESCCDRAFDVKVNGVTVIPGFRLLNSGPAGTPLVLTYPFTSPGTSALIELGGGTPAGLDHNPMLSALTLEDLDAVIPLVHYRLRDTDAAAVAGGSVPNAGTLGAGLTGGIGTAVTLSSDVPTYGVPPGAGNRSFSGGGTGGIRSPGTRQLNRTNVVNAGGFTYETWFKWNGAGSWNALIDYAGTEKLIRHVADPGPSMYDAGPIGAAAANQWHYVAAVFTPTGPLAGNGDLPGTYTFYLNSTTPVGFADAVISAFGDSLDRTLAVGMHPVGFAADYFNGLIYEPRVTLGALSANRLLFKPAVVLSGATRLGNGAFQFGFSGASGSPYTVLASTNAAAPLNTWSSLGSAVESPASSGRFQFTDTQAPNHRQRFYQVRQP